MFFLTLDGQIVSYLLKGNENLNIDKHVVSIIDGIAEFEKFINKKNSKCCINNYKIIPIGNNCGLVEYLSNVKPIYILYEKQLIAKHSNKILDSSQSSLNLKSISQLDNNSENNFIKTKGVFGSVLYDCLKKKNITINDRSDIPIDVLVDVFTQLSNEFSDNLILNELFIASNSTCQFINSQKLFIKSCASMNILGFFVGLGDRHLGNILLNFASGFVTHIDFNICFDRGKLLSIPETVPFRLSRNFISAFGSFGYQGNYMNICTELIKFICENEYIVKSYMKNQRYDQSVEWLCNQKIRNMRGINELIKIDENNNNTKMLEMENRIIILELCLIIKIMIEIRKKIKSSQNNEKVIKKEDLIKSSIEEIKEIYKKINFKEMSYEKIILDIIEMLLNKVKKQDIFNNKEISKFELKKYTDNLTKLQLEYTEVKII